MIMRKGNVRFRPNLPAWFVYAKDDSALNSRDVAQIFGYKTPAMVLKSVKESNFPPPDFCSGRSKEWNVSTIRKEIERRKNIGKQED